MSPQETSQGAIDARLPCGKAWYYSQDCQRKHWKAHKPTCLANRPKKAGTSSSSNALDAHKYYNTTARKDTPENMQLVFGPDWRECLGKLYDETRIDVLLDPPRGSPSFAITKYLNTDNWLKRSPRPGIESEKELINQVTLGRKMQDAVRRRIGAGKSPSTHDMKAVLSSYGPDWTSHLQTYMLAINTMDQGVQT
ncbi:hypothetical protein DHEL01_v211386 [Diaporthe helianthi]|uniref:MYND-type zinc finger protein samB n=1 Tax=Diaporthe helianthi TaxID=158607 RepID=A0A2P5HIY8_DIAHE|nr:hypothetical protein DHEL01_v211386 [Diaporthe helianthi]